MSMRIQPTSPNDRMHDFCDLPSQKGRNGVADLVKLLCTISQKKIVVWECLQPSRFSHCQASALNWVGVDKVVTIFGNVTGHRCARNSKGLNSKAIYELAAFPVGVLRSKPI